VIIKELPLHTEPLLADTTGRLFTETADTAAKETQPLLSVPVTE
jgi:hypothetical protein